ncbi:LysM peptidoglycan-binding domain-containing protein [Clostridium sp.]|uniref:LysM peptidoglycan-binding domain-containing protein n=1 Tax=Clostridium sp. TaxID=1506 RepID=UPI0039965319
MNFLIESFTCQEQDGSGDVYYTLNLKEYRAPKVYYTDNSNSNNSTTVATRSTPAATTNKTYIVKSGDTLWGIAKKHYGDGSKYTKIYEANKDKIKNPNVIFKGMELIIP